MRTDEAPATDSIPPGAIYRRLGVEPIVNGRSTFTILGGSLMPPEVIEAMRQAAATFVDLIELQEAVGRPLPAARSGRRSRRPLGAWPRALVAA